VVKGSVNAVGRGLLRGIRTDPLVRNSFYLVLTTLTIAIAGFGFWVINARIFTESQVGAATALITAVTLLSYLSQAGMKVTLVRHLGSATDPGEAVNLLTDSIFVASRAAGWNFALDGLLMGARPGAPIATRSSSRP
jgi:Polysaccharide biosynthesis protein